MTYAVFEGPDFAGKSTLTKQVAERLGWRLVAEPFTETDNSKRIKQAIINNEYDKQTELFMLASSRLEAFDLVIHSEREKGLISDRSVVSSMVYQEDKPCWMALEILDFMTNALQRKHHDIYPDHLFFLEIDHETYLDRLANSDRVPDEKEKELMVKKNWDILIGKYRTAIEWFSYRESQTSTRKSMKVHFITPETTVDEIVAILETKK
jgi:thymidylate kinase